MARLLFMLWLGACCAQAAEPLRVVILTRLSQSLPEAVARFEGRWGKDLMRVSYGDAAAPPAELDRADVVLAYSLHSEEARALAPRMRPLIARGVKVVAHWPEGVERHWGLKQDSGRLQAVVEYWNYGGAENMARMLCYLYGEVAGRRGVKVERAEAQLTAGIYHPKAPAPFATLEAYERWYGTRRRTGAARVGVLFYHTNLKNGDMAHIDALIAAIEAKGLEPVAVFGWPPVVCEPLLMGPGGSAVEALFALNLGFAKPDDAAFLARLNVHVMALMTTKQTRAEWLASPHGVRTDQLALQVAAPERAGATEPITFAATERSADGKTVVSVPIAERIERAPERAERWIRLRRMENSKKRLALVYYNSPPGKGNIGASYLNVPGTLAAVLRRLREEGYLVGGQLPEEQALTAVLEKSGRNIEEWAPGELEAMVQAGQVTLVSVEQYRAWSSELPAEFRRGVEKSWGPAEKSTLMTIRSRSGKVYFVVPGVRFGNVFVGPQPLRSSFAKSGAAQHDMTLAPPHCYVAAYLWMRRQFGADAIVHVGRHGTLEFLPGKNTGQAGADAAEAILGAVPNPYFYILDGGGESMTARRRSGSVMLSHLTPLLAPGGRQEELRPLREALEQEAKTSEEAPELAAQYRRQVLDELAKRKVARELGLDAEKMPWQELRQRVEEWLEEAEEAAIPLGVHTLGAMPREELQVEGLAELLRGGLKGTDEALRGAPFEDWAAELAAGRMPAARAEWSGQVRMKVEAQWKAGQEWLQRLRESPARELEALARVLRGEHLESGPSGDPLRMPASLPSGRNLHDFDPSLIPTPAACAVGKRLGAELLERMQRQTGRAVEKVSLVLWYGETIRHQGALECQALWLMGVEPKWNGRGVVDDLRLIPESELGRPRVDVVVTIAGIYRDGFPDKALLLDRASRLVQGAGENALSRNTKRVVEELEKRGLPPEEARRAAVARVFGPAPGDYGGGVAHLAKQSRDAQQQGAVADAYLRHNNHAYTAEGWGQVHEGALAAQLEGNQAIVHSRATNLYGVLDNDDFFDFAGGLNAATKSVNGGRAPELFVANLRRGGREKLQDIRQFLSSELQARVWNPKWIREMQRGGYAGAREMADHLENLYGWQATAPEKVDGAVWEEAFDVYVKDRHGLGLKQFFGKENPHARQYLLARLLEVDRQGSHKFSAEQRSEMVREYMKSVRQAGVGCSANTCGNRALQRFVAGEARAAGETGEAARFEERFRQAYQGGRAEAARPGLSRGRKLMAKLGVFRVPAEQFATWRPSVQVGFSIFLLFLAASMMLGGVNALGLSRRRERLVELHVRSELD